MVDRGVRWLYLAGGWIFLALGAAGIVLPVLPTTPFVLLAAWCFSRGSTRLHRWLLDNRTFGPTIRAWEEHRVIPLRIKMLASAVMLLLVGSMLVGANAARPANIAAVLLVAVGLTFIWSKPSAPRH